MDADGGLSLWQTNTSGNAPKPYLVRKWQSCRVSVQHVCVEFLSAQTVLLASRSPPVRVSFSRPSPASLLASLLLTISFVSVWQTLQCHNKTAHDFVFVGSSSLIATAGLSTDNRYETH